MLVPADDDHAGSAQAPAIDLEAPSTGAGLKGWGAPAAPVVAVALPTGSAVALRPALFLAMGIYVLALGGSAISGIRAPILNSVPLCLAPAAVLWWYVGRAFPGSVRMRLFIEATVIVITLGVSLACLSYLGALLDFPLRDREMIWADRELGFDWLQLMTVIDHWPRALKILDAAYATFTTQLLLTIFVLVIAKRVRDLDRFCVTFACASLLAEFASVILPTAGPIPAFAGSAEFTNLPTFGRTTADILLALREGILKEIRLDALDGIICFPSFHATVAIIVPFTLRWNKPLFRAAIMLNGAMLVSAVPSGNHYFADVLGGLVVAALAIVVSGPIQRSLARVGRDGTTTVSSGVSAGAPIPNEVAHIQQSTNATKDKKMESLSQSGEHRGSG